MTEPARIYDEQPYEDLDTNLNDAALQRRGRRRTIVTSTVVMAAAGVLGFGGAMALDHAVSGDSGTTAAVATTASDQGSSLTNALTSGTSVAPQATTAQAVTTSGGS